MSRITGIGGVFFRARDPDAMTAWYRDILGVPAGRDGYLCFDARSNSDPHAAHITLFTAFADDSTYFEPTTERYMLNFRVDDLDAVLARLRGNGVPIDDRREESEFGRFAWIRDPEGRRIELWQPPPERDEP